MRVNAAALDRTALAVLIPHRGSMCLLDEVLHWDAGSIRCRTRSHRAADHPLSAEGRVAAIHLIEYGAQAMAVHGGLLGGGARPGVLALVREARFEVDRIDDIAADLEIEARRLVAAAGGWMYEFSAHAGGRPLAQGRVAVMLPGAE